MSSTVKETNSRIWVSYHRDEQVARYGLHDDDTHRLFATHREAEGKNINIMNPVYSEMVTMWYVWKNGLKSEYVGFEHYRRRLDVRRMPRKGECQVYRTVDFGTLTIYGQYAQCHNAKDLDVMLSVLDGKYGKDNPYSRHIREGHVLVANCTFLMKWTDFTRLCRFLFPLLEACGREMGIEGYGEDALRRWREKADRDFGGERTDYQARVLSFLAERLISAWITTHLVIYNGIDVAIVHYNTPELTHAAIMSLNRTTPGCHVYLMDNSDRHPFTEKIGNVEIIDNTHGEVIDFEDALSRYPKKKQDDVVMSNYGSAKHCMSVDRLMDILPDGFVLMDSDVLVTRNIRDMVDRSVAATGVTFPKHNVWLLQPFLCFLNVPMLREHGIRYFNGEKMWALTDREPDCWYDTGAWLLEEIYRTHVGWKAVNIWQYIIHFGHGSWRGSDQRVATWLEEHGELWR